MTDHLGAGTYVAGMAGLIGATAALGWAAVSMRALVVPGWTGARARLAEAIVFLAVTMAVAQALGAVGLLRAPVVAAGAVGAGLALVAGARWWRARVGDLTPTSSPAPTTEASGAAPPAPLGARPERRIEWALAAAGLAVVGVQWLSHTADALRRGMPHPDTHWYHGPFVARFVQTGGYPELDGLGYQAARWFPFNAQVAQTLVTLPHERDWLVPLLNLGWFALALLAVWCIGERRRAGPAALSLAAVGLGLPIMAGTQPGQASTDIACAALLLAAVALLLHSDLAPGPIALAGAATGLGLSTKVTIAVPVAVLAVAVLVVLTRERRWGAAGWWTASIAATGTFWFGRNWVLSGNPLPWFDVPFLFDQVITEGDDLSLLSSGQLGRTEWDTIYHPGLRQGFGPGWVAVGLLLVLGTGVIVRGRRPIERIAGLLIVAGVVGYLASPATAGVGFVFNLRYLGPLILLSGALVPFVLPARAAVRAGIGVVALGLVAVGATAGHEERTPAWPDATWPALVVAVAGVLVVGAAVVAVRQGRVRLAPLVVVAVVVAVAAGWPVERFAADHRYVDAGLPASDVVSRAMRDISDADVVVYGTAETYPMFGLDLSNRVVLGHPPAGDPPTCAQWRRHLAGHYDYIAVSVFGLLPLPRPPDDALATDPAVTVVVRDGESALYRVDGALDAELCPA